MIQLSYGPLCACDAQCNVKILCETSIFGENCILGGSFWGTSLMMWPVSHICQVLGQKCVKHTCSGLVQVLKEVMVKTPKEVLLVSLITFFEAYLNYFCFSLVTPISKGVWTMFLAGYIITFNNIEPSLLRKKGWAMLG